MFRNFRLRALPTAAVAAVVVVAGTVLVPVVASAQSSQTPTAAGATGTAGSTLRQLEREAMRLTLVAQLPQADRADAKGLLDRADTLRQKALALRTQELQAYVDALKAGTAPADARSQAQQQVAADRTQLQSDLTTLRDDVQAFVQKVPEARRLLRYLSAELRPASAGGMGPGMDFGMGAMGPQTGGQRRLAGPRAGGGFGGYDRFGGYGWGGMNGNGLEMRQGFGMGRRNPAGMGSGRGWTPGPNGAPGQKTPQNSTPQNSTPPSGGGGA